MHPPGRTRSQICKNFYWVEKVRVGNLWGKPVYWGRLLKNKVINFRGKKSAPSHRKSWLRLCLTLRKMPSSKRMNSNAFLTFNSHFFTKKINNRGRVRLSCKLLSVLAQVSVRSMNCHTHVDAVYVRQLVLRNTTWLFVSGRYIVIVRVVSSEIYSNLFGNFRKFYIYFFTL